MAATSFLHFSSNKLTLDENWCLFEHIFTVFSKKAINWCHARKIQKRDIRVFFNVCCVTYGRSQFYFFHNSNAISVAKTRITMWKQLCTNFSTTPARKRRCLVKQLSAKIRKYCSALKVVFIRWTPKCCNVTLKNATFVESFNTLVQT